MTTGVAGGRSAVVAPAPERPREMVTAPGFVERPPGWSMAGDVTVVSDDIVPRYVVMVGGLIESLYATLSEDGSTSTVATGYVNGVSIGTVTLASSDTFERDGITPVRVVPGDVVHMRPTTAGTGAKGLYMNLEIVS